MVTILDFIFWTALAFMVADYTLGRTMVKDPLRAITAAVFAALFIILVHTGRFS